MTEPNPCETVAETLASGKPLGGSLAAHAATCPACRDLETAMNSLRGAGSAFPRPPDPPLVSRVTKAIAAEPLPHAAATSTLGLPGKMLFGIAALAVGVSLLTAALRGPSPEARGRPTGASAASSASAAPDMTTASAASIVVSPGSASATSAPTTSEDRDGQR